MSVPDPRPHPGAPAPSRRPWALVAAGVLGLGALGLGALALNFEYGSGVGSLTSRTGLSCPQAFTALQRALAGPQGEPVPGPQEVRVQRSAEGTRASLRWQGSRWVPGELQSGLQLTLNCAPVAARPGVPAHAITELRYQYRVLRPRREGTLGEIRAALGRVQAQMGEAEATWTASRPAVSVRPLPGP